MDFSLTDEQAMFAEAVTRFIDKDYGFEARQDIARSEDGYSADVWRSFADLGWLAMPFPEEDGGLGGGFVELMLLMEQFGRGLVLEPFVPTVVLAGGILRRSSHRAQNASWLAPLIAGDLQAAVAFAEPQSRFDLADISTTATASNKAYRLNGRKSLVLNGGVADLLIIPARTSGGRTDRTGITLFAVPGDANGIHRREYRLVDAHGAADLDLCDVEVPQSGILGDIDRGYESLQGAIHDATLAVSAEAVGILRAMHEKTIDYTKHRIQFGVPIGSFQALQHRMVDMLIAREQCVSALYRATLLAGSSDEGAEAAIHALKYKIGASGKSIAEEAVQIHGAMGVTWELDIAHFFKRFSVIAALFGDADFHLDRYVETA